MSVRKFVVDEDLVTGFSSIDEQHVELFQRLNKLLEVLESGRSVREVRGFILFLADYMKQHLELEERLMEKAGYPEMERHKKEHRHFKEAYQNIIDSFNRGEMDLPGMVRALEVQVGEWFVNHIKRIDRETALFLQEKGVS